MQTMHGLRGSIELGRLTNATQVRVGPAQESLPALARQMPRTFDFFFLDADKRNNPPTSNRICAPRIPEASSYSTMW
jgi:predicted O-methyltransferase YrrM